MNALKYLEKNEINLELDNLFVISLVLFEKHKGESCQKCGVIQGEAHRGWKEFYCKHLETEINKQLETRESKITEKFGNFMRLSSDSRGSNE